MPWNAIANALLSDRKREQELGVEIQSEYENWRREVYTELEIFVKRVNDLNLEESEERTMFYDLTDKFSPRFEDLRTRSEASNTPVDALIEIEKLVELLEDISPPLVVTTSTLNPTPVEKKRQEKRRKERHQRHIEKVETEMDKIAEQIKTVNNNFDQEIY